MRKFLPIYVESPFQLIQAFEIINIHKGYDIRVYARENNNEENNYQLRRTAELLSIKNINYIESKAFSLIKLILKLWRLSKDIELIYYGDENSKFFKISRILFENKIILLDDGVATINSSELSIPRFSIFNYHDNTTINSWRALRTLIKHRELVTEKYSLIIGSKVVEEGIISPNTYERFISHARTITSGKMYYIPHRGENKNNLDSILKKYNIEIYSPRAPIEIVALLFNSAPEKIISMFSTALFSMQQIYKESLIFSIRIDDELFLKRKKQIINIYEKIEESNNIETIKI